MLIVIMNNHSYNESRGRNMINGGVFYEAGKDFNGYLGDPNVEFTKIAEAYGLKGEKVKTASELAPALQRCMQKHARRQSGHPGRRRRHRRSAVEPGQLVSASLNRGHPQEEAERMKFTEDSFRVSRCGPLVALSAAAWPLKSRDTAPAQAAQIEKGRQVVAQVCATCHATLGRMIQVHKQTRGAVERHGLFHDQPRRADHA